MKKLFTMIVMAVMSLTASAQIPEKFTIGGETYNTEKASDQTWVYTVDGVDVSVAVNGRAHRFDVPTSWPGQGSNWKNNTKYTLSLPEGMSVYRVQFYGCALGTNFSYLCGYGSGDATEGYEWFEPQGTSVKRNSIIAQECKYPVDCCLSAINESEAGESKGQLEEDYYAKWSTHQAGYCFADIDFANEPYTGDFSFRFAGNQQVVAKIVLYTTRAAADNATVDNPSTGDAKGIELSWDTMLKNETGDNTADQANIKFLDAEGNETGFILKPAGGRTQAQTIREDCGKVLNFKNNTNQELIIPEGTKVYKINFYGWSQGDNWTYLYAYGPTVTEWEWTDPIGSGIQDNSVIIDQAKYPIDPCVVNEANVKVSGSGVYETTCFHNAGYCFASIDFSDEPYEGSFCFVFNGNNQERAWMEVFTSKEAAAAAPTAETPRLGKDKSQQDFLATGIAAPAIARQTSNAVLYNLSGQRVDASYKGLVIKNGKKYVAK